MHSTHFIIRDRDGKTLGTIGASSLSHALPSPKASKYEKMVKRSLLTEVARCEQNGVNLKVWDNAVFLHLARGRGWKPDFITNRTIEGKIVVFEPHGGRYLQNHARALDYLSKIKEAAERYGLYTVLISHIVKGDLERIIAPFETTRTNRGNRRYFNMDSLGAGRELLSGSAAKYVCVIQCKGGRIVLDNLLPKIVGNSVEYQGDPIEKLTAESARFERSYNRQFKDASQVTIDITLNNLRLNRY